MPDASIVESRMGWTSYNIARAVAVHDASGRRVSSHRARDRLTPGRPGGIVAISLGELTSVQVQVRGVVGIGNR